MSAWRRLASEAVPSCRTVIEKADSPPMMWGALWYEVENALQAGDEEKLDQIYSFLVQQIEEPFSDFLVRDQWNFVDNLVGAGGVGVKELAHYLFVVEFESRLSAFHDFIYTEEHVAEVRRIFLGEAKHIQDQRRSKKRGTTSSR